jgi:two-component system, OmpR family, alkaline phosphatase synthesis response regulator PhoP
VRFAPSVPANRVELRSAAATGLVDRGPQPVRSSADKIEERTTQNGAAEQEAGAEVRPSSGERILVIEDDHGVQKALKRLFEGEGFAVDIASNGAAGLEMFKAATPSIVLLDLRLPGMPGQDICREITQAAPSLPIIILSARTDVMDKVLLLELGAHDYVTKPFSPRELLARVRTAMRRSARGPLAETLSFGDVKVDIAKMEVKRGGNLVQLTSQEFKVLKFMIQNAERVLSREELLNSVWGYHNYPSTRTVDNHILRLRQKLEKDPANPLHFRTVHSAGYKFVP